MRKRIIAALFSALIFFAGWAFGQRNLDASNWSDLGTTDNLARLTYVKGYIRGYADGDNAMAAIAFVVTKNAPVDSSTKKLIAPQVLRLSEVAGMGKNHEITIGKITDTMTSFYSDYRNAPVCWNQALQFSIWSLSGDTPTDQEIGEARKNGAEGGCQ
jgi:hypothetical protein